MAINLLFSIKLELMSENIPRHAKYWKNTRNHFFLNSSKLCGIQSFLFWYPDSIFPLCVVTQEKTFRLRSKPRPPRPPGASASPSGTSRCCGAAAGEEARRGEKSTSRRAAVVVAVASSLWIPPQSCSATRPP